MKKTQKPQVGLVEQISQSAISSVLPMWSSCIRRKIVIVSDGSSPDHLMRYCLKHLSKTDLRVSLSVKEGDKQREAGPFRNQ